MKPRLGYTPPAVSGYVKRPDASALAAEAASLRQERDRYRRALTEIANWHCQARQQIALSALGQLENH